MKKLRILTFVGYYLPGYKSGGPVRTLVNMVNYIGDEFHFMIVTRDRDMMEELPYQNVSVNSWNRSVRDQVFYASPDSLTLLKIARLIRETPHDVIYLNSFFDYRFSIFPLIIRRLGLLPNKPVIVAPRGEFSDGALSLKFWKKYAYLAISNLLGLYRDITWQASSQQEAADIRKNLGPVASKITVAPNFPQPPSNNVRNLNFRESGKPDVLFRIVFLSRITPMKNLDFALKVLSKVLIPIKFDIYGGVNKGDKTYWEKCQRLIEGLPRHIDVSYHGSVNHAKVDEVLAQYDLFFLPTLGENYGHAIFEALAAGVPVLISDRTPWIDLEKKGVGYVRSLEKSRAAFISAIHAQAELDTERRLAQRKRVLEYAQKFFENEDLVKRNKRLFKQLVIA